MLFIVAPLSLCLFANKIRKPLFLHRQENKSLKHLEILTIKHPDWCFIIKSKETGCDVRITSYPLKFRQHELQV